MEYGSNGDQTGNRGWTAIHEAASHGLVKILKILLTRSTKRLNLELEDDGGVTPLFMAVTSDNAEAIKMLISYARCEKKLER